jgi:hypothetical protein
MKEKEARRKRGMKPSRAQRGLPRGASVEGLGTPLGVPIMKMKKKLDEKEE